jgi:cellulose biosynthesis protein BcsQ
LLDTTGGTNLTVTLATCNVLGKHIALVDFDTQYNDSFALLHRDAYDDARPISLQGVDARRLVVKLLTPLDLAVSKLSRFSEQDQLDIGTLAREGLLDSTKLRRRAVAALPDYVGKLDRIKTSIDIACRVVEAAAGGMPASTRQPRTRPVKK